MFGMILIALAVVWFPTRFVSARQSVMDIDNKICPVMGEPITDDSAVIYNGRKYHVCCPACGKMFSNNPEMYAKPAAGESPKKGV